MTTNHWKFICDCVINAYCDACPLSDSGLVKYEDMPCYDKVTDTVEEAPDCDACLAKFFGIKLTD